jgi:MarR family transcriptional regulator, transcriptional regulator for hemolysin
MSSGEPKMAREERPFRIGFLIHDVARLRRTVINKALKPLAVTGSQWWVLASLSRHNDQGMIQTGLAKVMDAGGVTLGSLIKRLEASGYIERQPDPKDRRVKHVVMSAKGARMLSKIQKIATRVDGEIMGRISRNDASCAELVLNKMKKRLIAMEAVPNPGGSQVNEE